MTRQIIKVINKVKIDENAGDFIFWQKKTYEERLAALEKCEIRV